MAGQRRQSLKLGVLLVVGLVLVLVGAVMFPGVDYVVRQQIKQKVIISNKSELYSIWQDIPVPIYMQFYMFDVYNVQEIKQGKKPFVVERGPYTYRERRVKYNIVWNPNGTVTYRQNRTFTFVPEMSVGDESDLITTINPLMATLAQGFKLLPPAIKRTISAFLALTFSPDFFIQKSVHQLLWGYDDPLLLALKAILQNIYPSWFITTKIGYFIGRNYTDDGLYTVYTGETDLGNLGTVERFNGLRNIDIWTTEWARMINGSDGSIGPPFSFDNRNFFFFVSDLCRSIRGVYTGSAETPQNIDLRRYSGDPNNMANATATPDNIGFCTPRTNCLSSGLLNGTLCQKPVNGFPVPLIFSFPHFLYSEPDIINNIYGMKPNKEEHDTHIDVEPWTGLVLQLAVRLQINMFVEKVDGFVQTADIRSMYFPIFWLNDSSVTDDERANLLKDQLFKPLLAVRVIEICLLTVGGLLALVSGALLLRRRYLIWKDRLPARMLVSSHTFQISQSRSGQDTDACLSDQDDDEPLLDQPAPLVFQDSEDDVDQSDLQASDAHVVKCITPFQNPYLLDDAVKV